MNSVFTKTILGIVLVAFSSNFALALDSEYKNSLTKVELTQTSNESYDVNLYLQKKSAVPVKIVKKSDLSYYILLPETKNSASATATTSPDIRGVVTNTYKYAGNENNNGYTKISITTTKPLNLNVNVKNTSDISAAKKEPVKAAAKTETSTVKEQTKTVQTEKKNSDLQKKEIALKQKKEVVNRPTQVVLTPKQQPKQTTVKKEQVKLQPKQVQKQAVKPVTKAVEKPVQKTVQKPTVQKEVVKEVKKETPKEAPKETPNNTQKAAPKAPQNVKPVLIPESLDSLNSSNNTAQVEQEPVVQNEVEPQIEQQTIETPKDTSKENIDELFKEQETYPEPLNYKQDIKNKIANKIYEYGLSFNDLIFMLFASLFSLIALFFILRRPNQTSTKLKSKADLIDKLDKTEKFVPKKTEENTEESGKYFIFDKNIKQTALIDPIGDEPKRNYELSNYDPENSANYGSEEDESAIIHKILKEDSLVEIAPGEFELKEEVHHKKQVQKHTSEPIKEQQVKHVSEPKVLSNVEIAPERGFMIVSYNDNVNLMGYIFDDVFALYNFKSSELSNYDIQYRLSDTDDKGSNYIVKAENSKIVVRVTKSQMNLLTTM